MPLAMNVLLRSLAGASACASLSFSGIVAASWRSSHLACLGKMGMASWARGEALQSIYNSLQQIRDWNLVSESPAQEPHLLDALTMMENVKLSDLGLNLSTRPPHAAAVSVVEEPAIDITAFLLPKNFRMVLHDHPGMTVCSKLLAGRAHLRTFTASKPSSSVTRAKLVMDCKKSAADPAWYLSAAEGNFHELHFLEDSVMLDLLLPPYSDLRPCRFYTAVRIPDSDNHYQLIPMTADEQSRNVSLPYSIPYKGFVPQRPKRWA